MIERKPRIIACEECGIEIVRDPGNRRYCTKTCRNKAWRHRNRPLARKWARESMRRWRERRPS